jgi:hypothetical protein
MSAQFVQRCSRSLPGAEEIIVPIVRFLAQRATQQESSFRNDGWRARLSLFLLS